MGTVLLFVALLVAVELSYRRWVRRTSSRRRGRVVIDLVSAERAAGERAGERAEEREAAIILMPARDDPSRHARRSG